MTKRYRYRVHNWSHYNKSLIERGDLELWINEESLSHWYELTGANKDRGRPRRYAELAIECCLLVRTVFHLPLRMMQGFMMSLIRWIKGNVQVPGYTQVCRRMKKLGCPLRHTVKGKIHALLDSTGLKVFGEGEWKVRQHGYSKHRTWRKLHLSVEVISQQIVALELTSNAISDGEKCEGLVNQYEGGYRVIGADKAYDTFANYETIRKQKATAAIEPKKNAQIHQHGNCHGPPWMRDEVLRAIRKGGRELWKKTVNYHARSLAETAFSRYKTIIGDKLRSRCFENQKIEACISCNILNLFIQRGKPVSVAVS